MQHAFVVVSVSSPPPSWDEIEGKKCCFLHRSTCSWLVLDQSISQETNFHHVIMIRQYSVTQKHVSVYITRKYSYKKKKPSNFNNFNHSLYKKWIYMWLISIEVTLMVLFFVTSGKFTNLGSRFEYVLNWKLIKETLVLLWYANPA